MLLALWDNGIRHTSNSKRPITKPERAWPDTNCARRPTDDYRHFLHSAPTRRRLAFSGWHRPAAGGGTAKKNPLMNIYSSKLHEVPSTSSLTGHKYETTPLLASKKDKTASPRQIRRPFSKPLPKPEKLNRQMSLDSG